MARTPGGWPGSEGSGGTKTVPMQCSAMSCGATPMCVARNGCGELPRRRARYKSQTGNHTAWMVSVVGTLQQSAARCPTAHSFAPQLLLRPLPNKSKSKWRFASLARIKNFMLQGVAPNLGLPTQETKNCLDSRPSGLGSGGETREPQRRGKEQKAMCAITHPVAGVCKRSIGVFCAHIFRGAPQHNHLFCALSFC